MEGWIKLHRALLDWEWFDNPVMVHIWVYLLLKANHEEKEWHGETIQRGQLVCGLNSMSKDLGISISKIRTAFDRLEKSHQIRKKIASKYTIITICNYDSYQGDDATESHDNRKQIASKSQANRKQIATNKNIKNERIKEDIMESIPSGDASPTEDEKPKKKKYSDERSALHGRMKDVFMEEWKAVKGTDYYWTPTDSNAIANIASKIIYMVEEDKKKDFAFIESSWRTFLHLTIERGDEFVKENLSPSLINSKFNNLYNTIKNHGNNHTQNQNTRPRIDFTPTEGGIESDI